MIDIATLQRASASNESRNSANQVNGQSDGSRHVLGVELQGLARGVSTGSAQRRALISAFTQQKFGPVPLGTEPHSVASVCVRVRRDQGHAGKLSPEHYDRTLA